RLRPARSGSGRPARRGAHGPARGLGRRIAGRGGRPAPRGAGGSPERRQVLPAQPADGHRSRARRQCRGHHPRPRRRTHRARRTAVALRRHRRNPASRASGQRRRFLCGSAHADRTRTRRGGHRPPEVQEPLSEQDVRIVTTAVEAGRAVVLAFNKWDLLDDERRYYLEREIERDLSHVAWAPRVNISAKTGRHAEKLVPAMETALEGWDTRIPTGRLNAFLGELVAANPHPVRGGKQPRILFGTQAQSRPPKFVPFTTGFLDHGYRRFITRRLRE